MDKLFSLGIAIGGCRLGTLVHGGRDSFFGTLWDFGAMSAKLDRPEFPFPESEVPPGRGGVAVPGDWVGVKGGAGSLGHKGCWSLGLRFLSWGQYFAHACSWW